MKRVFLIYPCGKMWQLRTPITIIIDGNSTNIYPDMPEYFQHAKNKFEINNLRVVEKDIESTDIQQIKGFISLTKKIRCVD